MRCGEFEQLSCKDLRRREVLLLKRWGTDAAAVPIHKFVLKPSRGH